MGPRRAVVHAVNRVRHKAIPIVARPCPRPRPCAQVDQARAKAVDDVEALGTQLVEERRVRAQLEQRAAQLQADLDAARAQIADLGGRPG